MDVLKILIIDDSESDANLLKRHIESGINLPSQIEIIHDPKLALETFKSNKPDLVFVDYELGALTGADIINQIRNIEPTAAIILLTGHSNNKVISAAMRAGATDFINKDELSEKHLIQAILQAQNRQKKDREQLDRHTNEQMLLAVEATPNGMIMVDDEGNIVMVNTAIEKMFGYQRQDLLGKTIELLVPQRYQEQHTLHRAEYVKQPKMGAIAQGRNIFAVRQDGSEFPVEIGLNPIATEQGFLILASVIDITLRSQQETAMQASIKEKELLLAEIHHRVKNNLQIINSLLNLQLDQITDPIVTNMLRESQNRIQSMSIIHQILYESNDFSSVNVKAIIENLINHLSITYAINPDKITIEKHLDTNVVLSIDKSIPLALILNELITNVFKHAFPDDIHGKMLVILSRTENTIHLSISDNGCGMPIKNNESKKKTLGLELIQLLSEQLEAQLQICTHQPTEFQLSFDYIFQD